MQAQNLILPQSVRQYHFNLGMEQTCLYRTKETLSPNRQKIDVLIIRNLVPKRKFRISRFFSYFLDDNIKKNSFISENFLFPGTQRVKTTSDTSGTHRSDLKRSLIQVERMVLT